MARKISLGASRHEVQHVDPREQLSLGLGDIRGEVDLHPRQVIHALETERTRQEQAVVGALVLLIWTTRGDRLLNGDLQRRDIRSTDLIQEIYIPDNRLRADVRCLSRTSGSRKSLIAAVGIVGSGPSYSGVRIFIGDGKAGVVRLEKAEADIMGSQLPEKREIEKIVKTGLSLKSDIHAASDYKQYMAGVFVSDMLHTLAGMEREP